MKRVLLHRIPGLTGLLPVALGMALPVRAFVYESPAEFQANGDFDGDGRTDLVIVDKESGGYRVAYQLTPGDYSWAANRASGVTNVTGLAVGNVVAKTWDGLAFTSPEANRVNLLDASSPGSAGLPVPVFIPSLGPNLVGAIDIGGSGNTAWQDFFVGSLYNNGGGARFTMMRNTDGATFSTLADGAAIARMGSANRVRLKTGTPEVLGLFSRAASDTFRAYDLSGGSVVQKLGLSLAAGHEFVSGFFNSGSPLAQFLFYQPGSNSLHLRKVLEPSPGVYSFAAGVDFALGQAIRQVFVLEGATPRLLVIFGAGDLAQVLKFDGVSAPTVLQSFTANSGEQFTGAGVFANGDFMMYSAPAGEARSSRFQTWNFNGSTFVSGAAGDLPFAGSLSAAGNVLQFQYEPFVTNNPYLLRVLNAGDWSSSLSFGGGTPPAVSVEAESFGGPSQGLGNPSVTALGSAHPLAQFGLVNQYTNVISVFSFQPPLGDEVSEVKIDPAPGYYQTAIEVTITPTDASHQAYYRLGNGNWQSYSAPFTVFTNVTVQYYARPFAGLDSSPIHTATYTFSQPPSNLDSDDDGVPDFVEIAKGLDPLGGPDSDGDGFSDLEELLKGSDPLSAADVPTGDRLEFKAAFDRAVTPRPYDGPANQTRYAATGSVLRAYNLQGSLLSVANVSSNLTIPGVTLPAADLTNIVVEPDDRLVVEASELHFDMLTSNPDKRIGRELIGLIPSPTYAPVSVSYTFGGGSLAAEAGAWITTASNAYAGVTRDVSKGDLTVRDTLAAALLEAKVAEILDARGTNWATNLTLFPWRPGDVGRTNVSQQVLLSLEKQLSGALPAYRIQSMYDSISNQVENSTSGAIINLRAITTEIYDICSTYNNTNPATFVPPLDELRYFLGHCTYDSNYLAHSSFSGIFASACAGASAILSGVPPRPITNVTVVATSSVYGQPVDGFELLSGGVPAELRKEDGSPYDLPGSFNVVPGSRLFVSGYTDISNSPASLVVEVISVALTSIPVASDADANGNLLIDTWEQLFFGMDGDPFGDWDGDGYTELQEMFEGSDPRDGLGIPSVPPVSLGPPVMQLITDGGQLRLRFNWPAAYINQVEFGALSSPDLMTPFTNVAATGPFAVGGMPDTFDLVVPAPPDPSYFFVVYLSLP